MSTIEAVQTKVDELEERMNIIEVIHRKKE